MNVQKAESSHNLIVVSKYNLLMEGLKIFIENKFSSNKNRIQQKSHTS